MWRAGLMGASMSVLSACAYEYDNVIPNLAAVGDSVAVAALRGPGTSGKLVDLLGDQWKEIAVVDVQASHAEVAELVGSAGAKEFSNLETIGASGAVLIFQYMHGAAQAVFIPRTRATISPEIFGQNFSHFGTFTIDSARQFVIRPVP